MGNDIYAQLSGFSFRAAVLICDSQTGDFLSLHCSFFCSNSWQENSALLEASVEDLLAYLASPKYTALATGMRSILKGKLHLQLIGASEKSHLVLKVLEELFGQALIQTRPAAQIADSERVARKYCEILRNSIAQKQVYHLKDLVPITELNSIKNQKYDRVELQEMPSEFLQVRMNKKMSVLRVSASKCTQISCSDMSEQLILALIRSICEEWNGVDKMLAEMFDANSEEVDLLVRDIYGESLGTLGLPGKIIAASLGKLAKSKNPHWQAKFVGKSLLVALSINIANLVGLLSKDCGTVVMMGHELHSEPFYLLIQSILHMYAPATKIWFLDHSQFAGCLMRQAM